MECHKKIKAVISSNPVEECDVQPIKECRHVTKLVPSLKSVDECVDVPSEVCAMSKVNPQRKKRPTIQKWCYKPEQTECSKDNECSSGNICEAGKCIEGRNDCSIHIMTKHSYCKVVERMVIVNPTIGVKLRNVFLPLVRFC